MDTKDNPRAKLSARRRARYYRAIDTNRRITIQSVGREERCALYYGRFNIGRATTGNRDGITSDSRKVSRGLGASVPHRRYQHNKSNPARSRLENRARRARARRRYHARTWLPCAFDGYRWEIYLRPVLYRTVDAQSAVRRTQELTDYGRMWGRRILYRDLSFFFASANLVLRLASYIDGPLLSSSMYFIETSFFLFSGYTFN